MINAGKQIKIVLFCLLSLTLSTLLMGLGFAKPEVALDTSDNILYQNISADKIISEFVVDAENAENLYKDNYYAIKGKISEKKANNKQITITGLDGQYNKTIKCTIMDKSLISMAQTFNINDIICVYGKFSVDLVDKDLVVSADDIILTNDSSLSVSSYALKNGSSMDINKMYARYLNDEKLQYYIPTSWKNVEHNIIDEELGNIEGYQYCLNEIEGSDSIEPESFFVCYFHNSLLKNQSDKKETDAVERAIISNILDKKTEELDKFPLIKQTTYYGAKYQYYQDAYQKPFGDGYHTEFVFQQCGNEGIILYLYVYKNKMLHINDIFYVMRFLEIGN